MSNFKARRIKSRLLSIKKLLIAQLLLIALMFTAVVAGTISYVIDVTAPIINTFTVGEADVQITEPGVDPNAVQWGTDTKNVIITIPDGYVAGVVRAMIVPVLKTETGAIIGGTLVGPLSEPVSDKMVLGDITLCFDEDWENYWFFKDGYFYYKEVLDPNEPAQHLLTGVLLTNPTPQKIAEYQDITVEINVRADMIQSVGGAPSIWGITVDTNGTVHD